MKFDFSQEDTPRPSTSKYLEAGVYCVDVAEWRTATLDNKQQSDFFEITFSCIETGRQHRERWFLSDKALWRLKKHMRAAGIFTLDFDDMKGTDRRLKASQYEIELEAKPPRDGKVYHELKSIKPIAKVAAPIQGTDEEIPF